MATDWWTRYGDAIAGLPALAARAPLTFCGNGACIDARVPLHAIGPMLDTALPAAAAFAHMLQTRAACGQGGEVAWKWPEGPAWIAKHLPVSYAMGGTGPHAAAAISAAGAPALLALANRSAAMLDLVPVNILLAEGEALVRAGDAVRGGEARLPVHIFEYTAGRPVGTVVPTRSSRIIVRFDDFLLENDASYAHATNMRARMAGAGLVSGFNSVPAEALRREAGRVAALARAWRERGLATVHLELAGYDTPDLLCTALAELRGAITSVGMSHSELRMAEGEDIDVLDALLAFGERLGVDRVCVHADHWAAAVTKRDPEVERAALMTGCVLAGARAAAGRPVRPVRLDDAVSFAPLPFNEVRRAGAWTYVACPSPHLRAPRTTLGLGDTFTGGCLLALGAAGGCHAP